MALSTKSGRLAVNRTATGRDEIFLPDVVSVVGIFVNISGTASVNIEVRDNVELEPIILQTVTANSLVRVYPPCSIISTNVTAVSGAVNISYRAFITDDIAGSGIEVFQNGVFNPPTTNISTDNSEPQILAQSLPTATGSDTDIYTVPAGKRIEDIVLTVCNVDATGRTYRLAVSKAGAAIINAHYLAHTMTLQASDSHIWHLGFLAETDVVRVRPSAASSIAFNLFGRLRDL
jgi:hypothetical protein